MIIIPHLAVSEAVAHMERMGRRMEERGGMFVKLFDGRIAFMPAGNAHSNPGRNFRLTAPTLAEWVEFDGVVQFIALVHSHVSGNTGPSAGDLEDFPRAYAGFGFVWCLAAPQIITSYNYLGETKEHDVREDVVLDAAA